MAPTSSLRLKWRQQALKNGANWLLKTPTKGLKDANRLEVAKWRHIRSLKDANNLEVAPNKKSKRRQQFRIGANWLFEA